MFKLVGAWLKQIDAYSTAVAKSCINTVEKLNHCREGNKLYFLRTLVSRKWKFGKFLTKGSHKFITLSLVGSLTFHIRVLIKYRNSSHRARHDRLLVQSHRTLRCWLNCFFSRAELQLYLCDKMLFSTWTIIRVNKSSWYLWTNTSSRENSLFCDGCDTHHDLNVVLNWAFNF